MASCSGNKNHAQVLRARNALANLAQMRSARNPLPYGFEHIEAFHNGTYQTWDYVLPWTKSACNLNASVMLVLQDWSSIAELSKPHIDWHQVAAGQSTGFATNTRIRTLLKQHFGMSFCQTYGTDLIPYAKPGHRRSSIPFQFMVDCARDFTLPEITIVKPCVVLAIGIDVFRALHMAHLDKMPSPNSYCFDIDHGGSCTTRVFMLSHPQRPVPTKDRNQEWQRAAGYHKTNCSTANDKHAGLTSANIHSSVVDLGKPDVVKLTRNPRTSVTEIEAKGDLDCILWRLGTCRKQCG